MEELGGFLVFCGAVGLMLIVASVVFMHVGVLAGLAVLCIEAILFGGVIGE